MGKYLVSPLTSMQEPGCFTASVSIRSGQGHGTHDRIFRFTPAFPSREGARRYAAQQGASWVRSHARATVLASSYPRRTHA